MLSIFENYFTRGGIRVALIFILVVSVNWTGSGYADGAPLLCAGITVYTPRKYCRMTEADKHLGVAGLGGLCHVAVKIGKICGLKVTVISSSPNNESEAIHRLGADSFSLFPAGGSAMDFIYRHSIYGSSPTSPD